jgi:hypothetical protein
MKKIYRNFITKEEADQQISIGRCRHAVEEKQNNIADKVINTISKDFDFEVKSKSYWSIEHRPRGHGWHLDTGSNNHMLWCQIGVSILLQDGKGGGDTYYGTCEDDINAIKSDRKLYDLVVHTSDEWHMVTPHEGNRFVFLMFI